MCTPVRTGRPLHSKLAYSWEVTIGCLALLWRLGIRTCVSSVDTVLRHVCRLGQSRPPSCSSKRCMDAGYVHKLNINEQLYNHLVRALDKHSSAVSGFAAGGVCDNWCIDGFTPEALRVGGTLKHDFEKQASTCRKSNRSRLTALVDLERRIGMQIGAAVHSSAL